MATTSEIQVTEAYIGLLGRAPDPAGLAYWTAQLDAAVAAGQTASDALKKLTNDITLSAEWDAGIGANDASTQAGAEAVVTAMYGNLFDRAATASDLTYWSAELVAGTTTASEMAVQLIVAAQANTNTTDADVLGFKQQGATYYVENVDQADFSRETANLAVKDVNGPISLDTSKDATDALVSGDGLSFALTAADDSASLVMTLGNDAVTGTVGSDATYQTTDVMNDVSTGDSDSLTLSGNAGFTFGQLTNVEAVNLNLAKQVGTDFTLAGTQNVTGSSAINIDVDPTVTIAGVSVTGETDVTSTGGLAVDVNTTDVTSLTAALATGTSEAALTITGDVDLATVTLTSVADSATNIVLADNDSTVNISGTGVANDAASISAVGEVDLDVSTGGGADVELLTLSGNGNDVDVTVEGVTTVAAMSYTTTGEHDVTLTGAAGQFSGSTIVQSGTGNTGIDIITTAADLNVWSAGVLGGGITLSVDQGANSYDYTLVAGTDFTVNTAQNAGATHVLDANDASTSSSVTINANQDTGAITTTDFESVSIDANDSQAITLKNIDTDGNDGTLTIVGANDITTGTIDSAGLTTISGKKISIGNTDVTEATQSNSSNADIVITASDDIATGTLSVQNDISLTATNDITVTGASDAVEGAYTVTGDDFNATGTLAAQNDITITTTNDVDLAGLSTSNGDIVVSANEIQSSAALVSTAGDITLTATNDADTSTLNVAITAAGTVTFADGKFTSSALTTADTVVISGDTDILASNFKANSVAITSTNDVTISTIDEATAAAGFVVAGSGATGDISITTDADATTAGTATIYTGSGDDTVTMDDPNTTFVVNTGGNTGTETVNADNFATGSVINTAGGDDIIDIDDTTAGVLTISAGSGDDTVNLANTAVTGTFDLGDGTADKVVLQEAAAITPTALGLKNIEELDISATTSTEFDWADLAGNDTTFKLIGAKTLKIDGAADTADTIDLTGITADVLATGNIQVDADSGNDVITGAQQMVNVINGDAGLDTITGGAAADTLSGGTGNDTITGGEGKDIIVGGDGKDTIILTESTAVTDTVTTGSGVGAEADSITGFTVGAVGVTSDDLKIDVSEIADALGAGVASVVGVSGEDLSAGAVTILDVSGAVDLDANTETIMYITGTYASTDAVETALEAGGTRELTTEDNLEDDEAMLIIYDDGTSTYLAALTTSNDTNNDTFDDGELTVTIIATLTGLADGDTIIADNLAII